MWAKFAVISCFLTIGLESKHYDTLSNPVNGKLNVHLVPHSHDDVGWLKTIDQYFVGSNNSIQKAAVQYILDSVVERLEENKNRRFIFVEQAFFQRWWREQDTKKTRLVHRLVANGQLEFINGGWCMHDEASSSFIDMIDQTTLGHRYIRRQFKKAPRVAWQIDPFGHSAVQGYLLSAEAGFDAVFFARADWQDVAKRRETKSMEFVWRASESLGSSAEVFGGVLHHHYDPPEGFRYDIENPDPPIQDDESLFDENVEERVEAFVQAAMAQAGQFRTDHIMWTMGEDFAYSNAQTWFKNMDKLIHYVNKDGRVNALYSTPSLYLDSKFSANESWPLKQGDFFPYADSPHNFWTGYFSSRPSLKGYVRSSSALLQAARQLEALVGRKGGGKRGLNTDELEEAVATAQHHDAVSGTSQQHVANDYAKRLYLGERKAEKVMRDALFELLSGSPANSEASVEEGGRILPTHKAQRKDLLETSVRGNQGRHTQQLKLERCGLLNISFCPTTEKDLSDGTTLVVNVYNPIGWLRKEFVKIPVTSRDLEVFTGYPAVHVPSQIVPIGPIDVESRTFYVRAQAGVTPESGTNLPVWQLVFEADLPALGYKSYFVKQAGSSSERKAFVSEEVFLRASHAEEWTTTVGEVSLKFHTLSGALLKILNKQENVSSNLTQQYMWYNASNGIEAGPQASGAYIFRPNNSKPFPLSMGSARVFRGPLLEQIHTKSEWASQVVTVFKGSSHAQFDFKIGPIPVDDGNGKEVISRLRTDLRSKKSFFTDSNCRDYLKRVVDFREDWEVEVTDPVAGNFYPVTAGMFLVDEDREFSLLVDRSVGGSSLRDGEAEIMLHRRLLNDDNKGVAEPLNESVCVGTPPKCEGLTVVGTYFAALHSKGSGSRWRRTQTQKNLFPLQLSFATFNPSQDSLERQVRRIEFSAVKLDYQLPPNVALITLQELYDGSILLRLAHLYEADEDEELSQMVTVDLSDLLPGKKLTSVEELSLTGNQLKSEMSPLKWNLDPENEEDFPNRERRPRRGRVHLPGSAQVELGPMEIRTFSVRVVIDM